MIIPLKRAAQAATLWTMCFLLVQGCAYHYVIPDDLDQRLDRSITFDSIKNDPEKLMGRLIVLGGVVLETRQLQEGTQIEVLELPLDSYDQPVGPASDSKGRFMVKHPGYLETASIEKGYRITVVGELVGTVTQKIDEFDYVYALLKAEFVHIWPHTRYYPGYSHPYPYPYAYPYPYPYYFYYPYYYPYYWYDPWWPYGSPPVIVEPGGGTSPQRRLAPNTNSPGSGSGSRSGSGSGSKSRRIR